MAAGLAIHSTLRLAAHPESIQECGGVCVEGCVSMSSRVVREGLCSLTSMSGRLIGQVALAGADPHAFRPPSFPAISFIDDDLELAGGEVLNTALAVFEAFDLLIAQPSVCNEPGSWTPYRALFTVRSMVLRYVNMVEIMAPIFEMEMFDRMVRPTLFDAYFGWGLDWLWPALLSYPPDKVAVIDEVCVYHPKTDRKNSALYKLEAPMTAREEANLHIKEWGWSPEGRAVRGFSSYSCDVISEVARPSPIAAPNLSNFLPGNNTMPSIVAGGIKHWLTREEPFRLSSLNQLGLLVRTIPVFIMGAGVVSVMLYRKKRRSVKRKITLG
ncbi:hypothetical protein ACKKBG_A21770 [Auxenochlorella protothecoides x Auxenochlorella symbiontica]